jgi:hypothetical protein
MVAYQTGVQVTPAPPSLVFLANASGGDDARKADPMKPVAWLAPVWTGR